MTSKDFHFISVAKHKSVSKGFASPQVNDGRTHDSIHMENQTTQIFLRNSPHSSRFPPTSQISVSTILILTLYKVGTLVVSTKNPFIHLPISKCAPAVIRCIQMLLHVHPCILDMRNINTQQLVQTFQALSLKHSLCLFLLQSFEAMLLGPMTCG